MISPAGSRTPLRRWEPGRKVVNFAGTGLRPVDTRLIFKGEPMSYQTILFDHEAGVATITFNRPEQAQRPEPRDAGGVRGRPGPGEPGPGDSGAAAHRGRPVLHRRGGHPGLPGV